MNTATPLTITELRAAIFTLERVADAIADKEIGVDIPELQHPDQDSETVVMGALGLSTGVLERIARNLAKPAKHHKPMAIFTFPDITEGKGDDDEPLNPQGEDQDQDAERENFQADLRTAITTMDEALRIIQRSVFGCDSIYVGAKTPVKDKSVDQEWTSLHSSAKLVREAMHLLLDVPMVCDEARRDRN